jgi:hypothetical protein
VGNRWTPKWLDSQVIELTMGSGSQRLDCIDGGSSYLESLESCGVAESSAPDLLDEVET